MNNRHATPDWIPTKQTSHGMMEFYFKRSSWLAKLTVDIHCEMIQVIFNLKNKKWVENSVGHFVVNMIGEGKRHGHALVIPHFYVFSGVSRHIKQNDILRVNRHKKEFTHRLIFYRLTAAVKAKKAHKSHPPFYKFSLNNNNNSGSSSVVSVRWYTYINYEYLVHPFHDCYLLWKQIGMEILSVCMCVGTGGSGTRSMMCARIVYVERERVLDR